MHNSDLALVDQCLAVIGEQFGVGREICGIVISVRMTEDIIAVWTRSAADRGVVLKIRSVSSLLPLIALFEGHTESRPKVLCN